jgi:8-oxo-dGTP pyrophosphatase MutT (NUDIX family)
MNGRKRLLRELREHEPASVLEAKMLQRIITFIEDHKDCFERTQLLGHVTGSAWIVDSSREYTLLVHHARLDKWLQPGGHCDGESDVLGVAMREALEETGLKVKPLAKSIFDVDAHDIPARKSEPAHVHYDVRYAFEASRNGGIVVSPESRDVRWVKLTEVASLNTDESVMRLVGKTPFLIR